MSTNAIVSAANLNIANVTLGEIRANKTAGKTVPIKYNGQSLQIRLQKMGYPMGIGIRENPDGGVSYTLSATLKGCDPYAKERAPAEAGDIGNFYNFLLDLKEKILEVAEANSARWFAKKLTRDFLRQSMKEFFSMSVEKVDGVWTPNGKYPPSLRMKVPVYDGRVGMDVTDQAGKPIEITVDNLPQIFPKRVEASVVVTPSIYVSGQGWGVTWRVTYVRVSPPQRLTAAQIFADEIEEETKSGPAVDYGQFGSITQVENSYSNQIEEEESEVPSAPAPAPAPEPAPAANRRRKIAAAM